MNKPKQSPLKLTLGIVLIGLGAWIIFDNLPSGGCPSGALSDEKGGCDQCPLMDIPSEGQWFCKNSQFYPYTFDGCIADGYPNLKTYPGQCILPDGTKFIQPIPTQSFEECAQWYPVMESYPRQCKDGKGTLWVEEIPST